MSRWAVKRDGDTKSLHDTYDKAFEQLLRIQGNSVHWAMRHEGWDIVEVRDEEGR
jgi:hypothetical protein